MAGSPRIVRLAPNGAGLKPIGIDPVDFQSPPLRQNLQICFSDPEIGLNVGVWDSTRMQEAFGPYPGDEFVLVLDGAFSMVDGAGGALQAKAGEMAAFRNGAPMSWKQDGYLRKFFLTLLAPRAAAPEIATAEGGFIVIDPAEALSDDDILPESESTGSGALERERIFFRNDAGTMTVGLWDCRAFDGEAMSPFPCHELCVMADGEVTIREPGGVEQTFLPGDVFFVPKGAMCSWHVPRYIRKFFATVYP
ncbi:MAG: cupin domain-containing protein [Pikeienuella sp.]|uniref:cupin domain-containing protein n=1 Tax=Pikeienuella sp. TaxID=2831957 RepID=UPI003918F469